MATALALLVFGAAGGTAPAAAPGGPRLAVLEYTPNPAESKILTLGPAGSSQRKLVEIPRSARGDELGIPAWSPDGEAVAFGGRRNGRYDIYVVPAKGGKPRVVPGTRGGSDPVFSPDGRSMAFYRFRSEEPAGGREGDRFDSASVWIVDLETGKSRQLTRWREDLYQFPSSFSPDGTTLLLTRVDYERSGGVETVALRFDGRPSSLLIGEGDFPVYSPDGSKIALTRTNLYWSRKKGNSASQRVREADDLYVIDADGTNLRRLTDTPRKDELLAGWDPSGERLAYTVMGKRPFRRGSVSSVMEINPDGTCRTKILSKPRIVFYGTAWQPGAGRGAGRIEC
jgi:TolB protein